MKEDDITVKLATNVMGWEWYRCHAFGKSDKVWRILLPSERKAGQYIEKPIEVAYGTEDPIGDWDREIIKWKPMEDWNHTMEVYDKMFETEERGEKFVEYWIEEDNFKDPNSLAFYLYDHMTQGCICKAALKTMEYFRNNE